MHDVSRLAQGHYLKKEVWSTNFLAQGTALLRLVDPVKLPELKTTSTAWLLSVDDAALVDVPCHAGSRTVLRQRSTMTEARESSETGVPQASDKEERANPDKVGIESISDWDFFLMLAVVVLIGFNEAYQ